MEAALHHGAPGLPAGTAFKGAAEFGGDELGEPEIGQAHPAGAIQQHVAGLDIAVNEARRVRRLQRQQHVPGHADDGGLLQAHRAALLLPVGHEMGHGTQLLSPDLEALRQVHDEEGQPLPGDLHITHLNNLPALSEREHPPRLIHEGGDVRGDRSQVRAQDLYGDLSPEVFVPATEDDAPATGPDLFLENPWPELPGGPLPGVVASIPGRFPVVGQGLVFLELRHNHGILGGCRLSVNLQETGEARQILWKPGHRVLLDLGHLELHDYSMTLPLGDRIRHWITLFRNNLEQLEGGNGGTASLGDQTEGYFVCLSRRALGGGKLERKLKNYPDILRVAASLEAEDFWRICRSMFFTRMGDRSPNYSGYRYYNATVRGGIDKADQRARENHRKAGVGDYVPSIESRFVFYAIRQLEILSKEEKSVADYSLDAPIREGEGTTHLDRQAAPEIRQSPLPDTELREIAATAFEEGAFAGRLGVALLALEARANQVINANDPVVLEIAEVRKSRIYELRDAIYKSAFLTVAGHPALRDHGDLDKAETARDLCPLLHQVAIPWFLSEPRCSPLFGRVDQPIRDSMTPDPTSPAPEQGKAYDRWLASWRAHQETKDFENWLVENGVLDYEPETTDEEERLTMGLAEGESADGLLTELKGLFTATPAPAQGGLGKGLAGLKISGLGEASGSIAMSTAQEEAAPASPAAPRIPTPGTILAFTRPGDPLQDTRYAVVTATTTDPERRLALMGFSPLGQPATDGELATGHDDPALAVLQLWNLRWVDPETAARATELPPIAQELLAEAMAARTRLQEGNSPERTERQGAPCSSPEDPRRDYLESETRTWDAIFSAEG